MAYVQELKDQFAVKEEVILKLLLSVSSITVRLRRNVEGRRTGSFLLTLSESQLKGIDDC